MTHIWWCFNCVIVVPQSPSNEFETQLFQAQLFHMGLLEGLSELLSKNVGVFVSALNCEEEPKGVCRLPSLLGSIRGQLLCSALGKVRPAVPRTWGAAGNFCFF